MGKKVVKCRCRCGHRILLDDEIESYAILPKSDYEELILNEARLFQSDDVFSEEHGELFYNQSQRIGELIVCPKCGVLIFVRPNDPADKLFRYFSECD